MANTLTPLDAKTRRKGFGPLVRKDLINGLLFISPWIVGFIVFQAYPVLASLYYSFTNYDIVSPPKFAGLSNYVEMFTTDPNYFRVVRNTLFYALIAIPLNMLMAVCIAMLLNQKVRGLSFFRTLFFLPSVVPEIASALLWAWILNPQFGLINNVLKLLGIPTVGWMADPNWAKPGLILIGLWGFGGSMVIYLASLQDIPRQLYEAADIDGANSWQKTFAITIPMLTPTIFFNLVLGIIGALQYFTTAFVLSGPAGSTTFYSLHIFSYAFTYFRMGYASALAWVLFAAVLLITLVLFKTSGRWVYYEGDKPE